MISGPPDPDRPGSDQPRGRAALRVFIAIWLAWSLALGWLRFMHPDIDHGDPTTDANILNAGERWDRDAEAGGRGLWGTWGIPAIDTFCGEGKTPDWYVTYPPGAYWFHQAVKAISRAIARTAPGPGQFRAVSVGVSALAVMVLFALVRRYAGGGVALATCVLYMTARPFVEYADNLHYISLSQLSLFASLYAWSRFESAQTAAASGAWLGACAAAFMLDAWLTFEHTLFILAFAAIRSLWVRRPGRLVAVGLLAAAPVLVMTVRLIMNRAVLGSFGAAVEVLRAKAGQRFGSGAAGTGWRGLLDAWIGGGRLSWPGAVGGSDSPAAEFAIPLISGWIGVPLAALGLIAVATWHAPPMQPIRRGLGLGLLLLIGGLTWFAVMTEHAIVHRFDSMLILPGLCVLAGALVAAGAAQRSFQPRGAPVRWVGRGLAAVVLIAWIGSLKSSFALNSVVEADRTVRQAIDRRSQAAAGFREAGRTLARAGLDRLWMLERDAPAARLLGLPFDNRPGEGGAPGLMRMSLGEREAQVAPLWTTSARHAAAAAVDRLGLPDVISPISAASYVVFRPGRAEADRVSLLTRSGVGVSRLAWRPTLDSAGVSLCMQLAQIPGASGRIEFHLIGVRADGSEARLASLMVPGTDGVRAGDSALVWMALDRAHAAGFERLDLRTVVRGRPAESGWDVERSTGRDGLRVAPTAITWTTAPPRAEPDRPTPVERPGDAPPAR